MQPLSTEQIVALRPAVDRPQPSTDPIEVLHELEAADSCGRIADVTTVLLRGSECSFRCTMCDLWKSTHLGPTPRGNLPAQIRTAIRLSPNKHAEHWIKLYNASNFFAAYNVPTEDLPAIAELVKDFDRVVVENHPLLISADILRFAEQLNGRLEVAMGLETIEPNALRGLNKRMNVEDVQRATESLMEMSVDVRLFVLLRPPGMNEEAAIEWCLASIEAARRWGARHVSIIPVRSGNGAMEHLQSSGSFTPPLASSLERILATSVGQAPMVVTADTWNWDKLRGLCDICRSKRRNCIEQVNLTQRMVDSCDCDCCSD